jgi:chemotaxis protein MotA
MDKATWGGLFLAAAGVAAGLLLEGGNLSQILQPTAALIVFGGTLGAIFMNFPLNTIVGAAKRLRSIFLESDQDSTVMIRTLVAFAQQARKEGIVSLDAKLEQIQDPFMKKSLMLAVDGTEPGELRQMMEMELESLEEYEERFPQVLESAGGFAPTIGILGAILGLIQVMQHLDKIDEVGRGIAVAFVATIYGVGSANLFFLPCAGKLKLRIREEHLLREMTLEGIVSILEGINPRMLEAKLRGLLADAAGPPPPERARAAGAGGTR